MTTDDHSLFSPPDPADLTEEQRAQAEQMAQQMAAARSDILGTEAATIIVNHAFGLYELAAIHVTADEPDLTETRLAIDALDALLRGLKGRLGEEEATLNEAIANIKMVYVQRVNAAKGDADA